MSQRKYNKRIHYMEYLPKYYIEKYIAIKYVKSVDFTIKMEVIKN